MANRWVNRFYMGTWQFGGQFSPMTRGDILELLNFALLQGIRRFDTAIVYGRGQIESILGEVLPTDAYIVTKVPARSKPSLETEEPISNYYNYDWILRNVEASLAHLKRDKIDTVLLHNWSRNWRSESSAPLMTLQQLKEEGIVKYVGISLPDSFDDRLDGGLLPYIDVIEAPYNPSNRWITSDIARLMRYGKEVMLRSLFVQGMLFMTEKQVSALAPTDIRRRRFEKVKNLKPAKAGELLRDVWRLGTSVVVGMTSQKQITENLFYISEGVSE